MRLELRILVYDSIMPRRALLIFCALVLCVSGQSPAPSAAGQKAIIARMRDAAVNYADRLQDFLCTQLTTRSVDSSGDGKHWKLLETQEMELGYIAHKEHYKLLKVNGKTTNLEKRVRKGYFRPGGEFGTALLWIFDPKAAAEFEWDHEERSADERSCVFRYRVAAATSTLWMTADLDHVRLGHKGFVEADCETGALRRIHIESEPASVTRSGEKFAIGVQLDVRYGLATIASREFLVPQQAVEIAPFGKTLTKAEIQFQQYRKYDSSSSITFDDAIVNPEPVK
jgi:hypothetical protein